MDLDLGAVLYSIRGTLHMLLAESYPTSSICPVEIRALRGVVPPFDEPQPRMASDFLHPALAIVIKRLSDTYEKLPRIFLVGAAGWRHDDRCRSGTCRTGSGTIVVYQVLSASPILPTPASNSRYPAIFAKLCI